MNKTLTHLNASSNRLTKESCSHLSKLLLKNATLSHINVACNNFGTEGGSVLLQGIRNNGAILRLDLRLTNSGKEVDLAIEERTKANRKRRKDWNVRNEIIEMYREAFG